MPAVDCKASHWHSLGCRSTGAFRSPPQLGKHVGCNFRGVRQKVHATGKRKQSYAFAIQMCRSSHDLVKSRNTSSSPTAKITGLAGHPCGKPLLRRALLDVAMPGALDRTDSPRHTSDTS